MRFKKISVSSVSFTPEAEADLDAIFDYLAEHDDRTSAKVMVRILQAIAYLESFSMLGRPVSRMRF